MAKETFLLYFLSIAKAGKGEKTDSCLSLTLIKTQTVWSKILISDFLTPFYLLHSIKALPIQWIYKLVIITIVMQKFFFFGPHQKLTSLILKYGSLKRI